MTLSLINLHINIKSTEQLSFLMFSNKTIQVDTDCTMEYLSFNLASKSLTLKKDILPKPKANEVRIKVAYSGICGTDLHILEVSIIKIYHF